jgi:hypothetical protein
MRAPPSPGAKVTSNTQPAEQVPVVFKNSIPPGADLLLSQGHGPINLGLQNNRSLRLLDPRNLTEAVGQVKKRCGVGNSNFEEHAQFAGHGVTLFDGRNLPQRHKEFRTGTGCPNPDEGENSESQCRCVKFDSPFLDDAFLLKPAKTVMYRRRSQMHQSSEILKTLGGVPQECLKQSEIFSVQIQWRPLHTALPNNNRLG